MASDIPHSTVPAARHLICAILISFAAACFIGTLLTDLAYVRSAQMMWADFSAWLLTAGVIIGWLAVIAGLIDYFADRQSPQAERPSAAPSAAYGIGSVIALVLATINMFVHTRDAWTSVMPWGLVLSIAMVVVLLAANWLWNVKLWEQT